MKKLFTLGFIVSTIAVSIVACTKNNSNNPTPSTKNLSTFIRKDTVTPPHPSIVLRDTVTPPKLGLSSFYTKKDTVTPPHSAIAVRDTVTPPKGHR